MTHGCAQLYLVHARRGYRGLMCRHCVMRVPALFGLLLPSAQGFYLPGVAPRTFRYGDKVELKVNKLTSVHTQLPYDYYTVKFCEPHGGVQQASENLGEFLTGDRIENSPYQLYMEEEQLCNILCAQNLR